MVRWQSYYLAIAWATVSLLLTACTETRSDLTQYVDKVKQSKVINIEPIPIMLEYEQFRYDARQQRDPFRNLLVGGNKEAKPHYQVRHSVSPDLSRHKEALEAYDIKTLQFVGTLQQEETWALVKTSDGIINRVQVGNYLGGNHGKIIAINEHRLSLREIVMDAQGIYQEKETILSIAVAGE